MYLPRKLIHYIKHYQVRNECDHCAAKNICGYGCQAFMINQEIIEMWIVCRQKCDSVIT